MRLGGPGDNVLGDALPAVHDGEVFQHLGIGIDHVADSDHPEGLGKRGEGQLRDDRASQIRRHIRVAGEREEAVGLEIEVELRVVLGLADRDQERRWAQGSVVGVIGVGWFYEGPDGAVVGAHPSGRWARVGLVEQDLDAVGGVADHPWSSRRGRRGERRSEPSEHTLQVVDALLVGLRDDSAV